MTPVAKPAAAAAPRATEIVEALQEDIIFGRLGAGARITEDALLARFPEATRHLVRQAIFQLERMGVLSHERNKGAMVRSLAPDEVRELYALREMLQRQAALAIPLPADPTLVERLEAIHREYCASVDAGSLPGVHALNDRFHLELFGACGNRYLVEAIQHYMQKSLPVRAAYQVSRRVVDGQATAGPDRARLERSRTEHRLMIDLLRGQERWALAQLCVDHLHPSQRDYLARIAEAERAGRTG